MSQSERFDYDAALRDLMELRFAARIDGRPLCDRGRWLARRIHAHVLYPHEDADGSACHADEPAEKAA